MPHDFRALATFYDAAAARYDSQMEGVSEGIRLRDVFRKRVSAMAGAGTPILDFGCGTGTDADWYAANGHRVIAYDISEGMVNVLRTRCAAAISRGTIVALAGEFEILLVALEQFGPVAAIAANFAVLNHVPDLTPLLQRLAFHLRPKGVLIATMLNPFYLPDIRSRWWWKGMPRSLWAGNIRMVGDVTTYRHYIRSIRRMAAPHFKLVEHQNSASAMAGSPSGSGSWRDSLNSNFMILVLRKPG